MKEKFYIPETNTHLDRNIKEAKPIMACVGTQGEYYEGDQNSFYEKFRHGTENLTMVNWHSLKSNDRGGAVSSPIDSSNKFTEGLADCNSLIVAGIENRKDGIIKNISFLTHQDPKQFLFSGKTEFTDYLKDLLNTIKEKCKTQTIDAVITGGSYVDGFDFFGYPSLRKKFYLDSIKLIGEEVKKVLGFEPIVINGPHVGYQDSIYYDNDDRKLYFIRPEVNSNVPDFPTSDIKKVKKDFPKQEQNKDILKNT